MVKSEEVYTKKQDEPMRRAFAVWLSRLYLLAAAALLLHTCVRCSQENFAALADSRAVQAFSSLAESLREGDGVAEAFSASYRVLSGAPY